MVKTPDNIKLLLNSIQDRIDNTNRIILEALTSFNAVYKKEFCTKIYAKAGDVYSSNEFLVVSSYSLNNQIEPGNVPITIPFNVCCKIENGAIKFYSNKFNFEGTVNYEYGNDELLVLVNKLTTAIFTKLEEFSKGNFSIEEFNELIS